ncbi:MAG TPA: tetratricopeptide repeat protein, partial [Methanocorpusculum sp.]|nr:tetratricopeptide repeat protein [Methanocorpusculum sp.]
SEDLLSRAEDNVSAFEYDAAEKLYREYLDTHQDDAAAWCSFGQLLSAMNNPTDAANALGNAFDLQPENPSYAEKLGEAFVVLHSFEEAKALFERAAENDKSIYPKVRTADMLILLNNEEKAAAYLQKLAADYPDEPDVWNRIYHQYVREGKTNEASAALDKEILLRKTLAEKTDGAGEWFAYGIVSLEKSAYADAESAFLRSLSREESSDAHLSLAKTLAMSGKTDEARNEFAAGVGMEPRNLSFVLETADTLSDLQLFEEAIAYYTKALELRNVRADTWASLAYALFMTGKKEEARAFFEMAKASAAVRELKWADKLHKTEKTAVLDDAFGA